MSLRIETQTFVKLFLFLINSTKTIRVKPTKFSFEGPIIPCFYYTLQYVTLHNYTVLDINYGAPCILELVLRIPSNNGGNIQVLNPEEIAFLA